MAIRNIKELINNKGYTINQSDRKIFEESDLQSFFGFSESDAIEFIIYDINDNQLPQVDGKLVRYIPLTTQNINDYFLIQDGTLFQKYKLPNEYFIDAERLLSEAGYTNGIFKTQITLINKRAGSQKEFDKLWINEISPSRTEVRLYPLKEGVTLNAELQERFNIFINDGDFREDTIAYALEFIESIDATKLSSFIKTKYGNLWVDELISEFKIKDFEVFLNTIYVKFRQATIYEFTNRISDLRDLNYGKPKQVKPKLELSKSKIKDMCFNLIIRAIDFYLLTPDVVGNVSSDIATDESKDIVGQVLQRTKSDTQIDTTNPEIIKAQRVKVNQKDADIKLALEIKKEDPPIAPPNVEPTPPPIYKKPIDGGGDSSPVYGGGGGGGGSSDYFERGGGYGREQVFERDMNQRENLQ